MLGHRFQDIIQWFGSFFHCTQVIKLEIGNDRFVVGAFSKSLHTYFQFITSNIGKDHIAIKINHTLIFLPRILFRHKYIVTHVVSKYERGKVQTVGFCIVLVIAIEHEGINTILLNTLYLLIHLEFALSHPHTRIHSHVSLDIPALSTIAKVSIDKEAWNIGTC